MQDSIGLYIGDHGKLRRIPVKRVRHGSEKVANYLLKAWRRTPSLSGELLVLPRPGGGNLAYDPIPIYAPVTRRVE